MSNAALRVLAHSSRVTGVSGQGASQPNKRRRRDTTRQRARDRHSSPLGASDTGRLSNDRKRFKFGAHEVQRERTCDFRIVARRTYFRATRVFSSSVAWARDVVVRKRIFRMHARRAREHARRKRNCRRNLAERARATSPFDNTCCTQENSDGSSGAYRETSREGQTVVRWYRRHHVLVWVVAGLNLTFMLAFVVLIPPYHGPDEASHFDMVHQYQRDPTPRRPTATSRPSSSPRRSTATARRSHPCTAPRAHGSGRSTRRRAAAPSDAGGDQTAEAAARSDDPASSRVLPRDGRSDAHHHVARPHLVVGPRAVPVPPARRAVGRAARGHCLECRTRVGLLASRRRGRGRVHPPHSREELPRLGGHQRRGRDRARGAERRARALVFRQRPARIRVGRGRRCRAARAHQIDRRARGGLGRGGDRLPGLQDVEVRRSLPRVASPRCRPPGSLPSVRRGIW